MIGIALQLHERAIVVRNGQPTQALGPGRYTFWRHHEMVSFDTRALTFSAHADVLRAMPAEWYETVQLAAGQYGIVIRDERPVAFLAPGVHRLWKVDPAVSLRVFDERDPLPELTAELRKSVPTSELVVAQLELNQRAVLVRDGVADRVLGPGQHAFWAKRGRLVTWNVDELSFDAPPEVLALVPDSWYQTVALSANERAVIYRDARPVKFLRPGVHRIWTVHPNVAVQSFDVTGDPPELTDELRAVIPAGELVEAQVKQFERGLKYAQGKFEAILEPGRYAYWNHPGARISVQVLDTRVQQLKIEGQELMTKDKVTLRLTLMAEYAPADAAVTVHAVADAKESIYLAVQLAAREFVAGVTLDEMLDGRDAMTRYLETQVVPRAEHFGIRIHRVGVKDVILPGEMKTLLNKVIEAEKAAAANVILRREDAAATRNMANTAKVIAENPVLMRLKELETMKEIAEKIDELKLVLGTDGLAHLLPHARGEKDN